MRNLLIALLTLLGLGQAAYAQQAIQAAPSHLDAATQIVSTTAAVNTALTATLSAVSGKYHQIQSITLNLCNDATGSANANLAVSATNLTGFTPQIGSPATAGQCFPLQYTFPMGLLDSAAGTATTIVIPQPGAHTAASMQVFYNIAAGVSGNQ